MKREISLSEWQVMRVLWAESQLTSRQIVERLIDDMDWNDKTIKTLLNRLVKKGYVTVIVEGRYYTYSPAIPEIDHVQTEIKLIIENICQTKHYEYLKEWLDYLVLSQNDIDHLISILEEKRVVAPEKVTCHCQAGQCNC